MKCEICGVRPATIWLRQGENDAEREMCICHECALKNRDLLASSFPFGDAFFELAKKEAGLSDTGSPVVCPECGLSRRDFKKRQRLGCAACFKAHAADVKALVSEMQGADQHIGKIPAAYGRMMQARALEKQLGDAVAAERFEDAAILRDEIKVLKDGAEHRQTGVRLEECDAG